LAATEDKLEYARRYYNSSVLNFNTAVQTMPRSLVAPPLGFRSFGFFQAQQGDQAVPAVGFTTPTGPHSG